MKTKWRVYCALFLRFFPLVLSIHCFPMQTYAGMRESTFAPFSICVYIATMPTTSFSNKNECLYACNRHQSHGNLPINRPFCVTQISCSKPDLRGEHCSPCATLVCSFVQQRCKTKLKFSLHNFLLEKNICEIV